jgi:PAS domain S-box-containing protein
MSYLLPKGIKRAVLARKHNLSYSSGVFRVPLMLTFTELAMTTAQTARISQVSEKKRTNRILVVEDSPTQAQELLLSLASEELDVEIAADAETGLLLFQTSEFDLVITDVVLPGMSGYELCQQIKNHSMKGDVPVFLLTSLSDPMNIIQGLECGANSFITKPYEANYLRGRVKTMLDKKAHRASSKVKVGAEVIFLGKKLTINSDKEQILDLLIATFEDIVRTNQEHQTTKTDLRKSNEQLKTRLKESSADLDLATDQMSQLAAIVESSADAIIGCTLAGLVIIWNQGAERLFGYSAEEVIGQLASTNARLDWPDELRAMKQVSNGEHVPPFETVRQRKDGKEIHVSVSVSPIRDKEGLVIGASAIYRDISDRKKLEEQFHQAQRMEAVGQLAGGVAHDFNNLLTVISGYSEMLMIRLPTNDPTRGFIQEIHKAGERAAHLTRQLLAFSRKAIVERRVLDLNALVTDTEKMLRRLIGEDISLATVLAPALGQVNADTGQIEQIIVNLAVNARDAMPQGGKLTIETRNVEMDAEYAKLHPEVRPGRYVMVAVSDTGSGMSPGTKAHIFEPFFTTKGPGKGTGLGLATVYGIVKQSGGHIAVYSELGQGTSFKIYLPPVEDKASAGRYLLGPKITPHGNETVLLVEDEDAVRAITKLALQSLDYTVLEARNGEEAVRICEQHTEPIHLLITDVVMPEMGGRQVAERLAACKQGIKVLFLSGYTDDAVVRHGILQAEVAFLQKPFTPMALANKVRDVLDQ